MSTEFGGGLLVPTDAVGAAQTQIAMDHISEAHPAVHATREMQRGEMTFEKT